MSGTREGLDLVLAWSDCFRMSNVAWLANYRGFDGVIPYSGLVLVPAKGAPILFATEALVGTAKGESWIAYVRGIRRDLGPALSEWAASTSIRGVGIAGYRYLAMETWDVIHAALPPHIAIGATDVVDVLKSVKTEEEIRRMLVAGQLADIACDAVRQTAAEGVTERELVRAANTAMFAKGADAVAFDVMVQAGENSATTMPGARPTAPCVNIADLDEAGAQPLSSLC